METEEMEFIELVLRMREFQKRYFRTRDNNVLDCCKSLEKQVDDYITQKLQPELF